MTDDDFDDRVLCTDGACLGVIGAAGRCALCGTPGPATSTVRRATPATAADDDGDGLDDDDGGLDHDDDDHDDADRGDENVVVAGDDFATRVLCPDDACIGVLGLDRRCPICGRSDVAVPG